MLRESARKCGIWENPPIMREINMKTMEVFTKKVHIYSDTFYLQIRLQWNVYLLGQLISNYKSPQHILDLSVGWSVRLKKEGTS